METSRSLAVHACGERATDPVRPAPAGHDARQRLHLSWAVSEADVRAAQRLRYQVFAQEMGARVVGPAGLDVDAFDAFCDHLLVRDTDTWEVVGTYRLLPPEQARRLGRLYAETEFDLSGLDHPRERTVEIGRSCVHPDYRSGAVIMLLWTGLADYMARHRCDALLGCTSVTVADGGHFAADLYHTLRDSAAWLPEAGAVPRMPLPVERLATGGRPALPPLMKGYLRVGARICGAPAWDPHFKTADFLTLLRAHEINQRYARHFMGAAAGAPARQAA